LVRRAEDETSQKLRQDFEKTLKLRDDALQKKELLVAQFQSEKLSNELKLKELEQLLKQKPKEVIVEKKIEVPSKPDQTELNKLIAQVAELERRNQIAEKELQAAQAKACSPKAPVT
jgi:hypothetical protein